MSFWCLKFSKKPTKNLTNFCPESKKWSNHKTKAPYSVFNTLNRPRTSEEMDGTLPRFAYDYMDYLMYYSAFILWSDHFLDSGQKFVKFFVGFLENLKKSKRRSDINFKIGRNFYRTVNNSRLSNIHSRFIIALEFISDKAVESWIS